LDRSSDYLRRFENPGQDILSSAEWAVVAQAFGLSPREIEVVQCMFEGLGDRETSAALGCTRSTVHTHVTRLFRKVGENRRERVVVVVIAAALDRCSQSVTPERSPGSTPTC